mgnify:FL=1
MNSEYEMRKFKLKDGRTIVLRAMTKSDIMAGGNGRCPANRKMTLGSEIKPTENFRILNEKMIDKYGTTTILALDQGLIAGFVNFYPTWCPHFDICDDEQINEAMAHLDVIDNPPSVDDPALHPRCLIVRNEYRGNNLAVELLNCLKIWAKANGWRKIVGNGCIFSGKAQYQWIVSPKPPKPIWERAGFSAQDYLPLGMKSKSSPDSAKQTLQWYKGDNFPKHVPRDIDPNDKNWYEIFADYTMICNLE